jgi:hypothetical protein
VKSATPTKTSTACFLSLVGARGKQEKKVMKVKGGLREVEYKKE